MHADLGSIVEERGGAHLVRVRVRVRVRARVRVRVRIGIRARVGRRSARGA